MNIDIYPFLGLFHASRRTLSPSSVIRPTRYDQNSSGLGPIRSYELMLKDSS